MGIRTLLWAGFFFGTCIAAFANPIWGLIGYIGHYTVGPESQWWALPVNSLGLRYSFTLAGCTAIGIFLHRMKSTFRGGLLHNQQKLILVFLGIVWMTTLISPETVGRYTSVDHPSVKLTKVVIFCFMLCHVATTLKDFNRVLMILVIGAFVLGQKAYEMPRSAFIGGRLEGVGGPDFAESNFFAAFLVGVLPIIGVQFFRATGYVKLVCLVSGVFVTNAIVLARSRGAFLALAATAIVAVFYAPKHLRNKIYLGLILAAIGAFRLADEQFLERMTTIFVSAEDRDSSSDMRLEAWKAGLRMVQNHPLGIGTGNWYQQIPRYAPDLGGLDSHSTYVKLLAEQGFLGAIVFGSILLSAFFTLRRVRRRAINLPPELSMDFQMLSLGLTLSMVGFFLCCGLITLLYMEALWWFLVLPICLERTLDHSEQKWLEEHQANRQGNSSRMGNHKGEHSQSFHEATV
ncbi:O-antigen ligase family protein [Rhodopirellula sp. JC639]|uniref:O-antigen ligase family protein n=1 Tax=Stieleria mannarensis TaxID=2755585 RepID=UPI00160001CF|nr:O-antigen ligase family protein [Rhodopirellula sp. JC639]